MDILGFLLKLTREGKMQNELTVGSLFSGVGGVEIGFEKQGFKTRWFVEKEPYAQAVLQKRFPNTKIYGDITKIDFRTVPKIDILTGGFPCQDISNAGKRAGIEGSRSSLWKYYLEAIRILRPKIAFIENVSALLDRGLDVVLADLAKIGYDAEWYCVSASSVGAFHKRRRIFILTYPNLYGQHSFRQGGGTVQNDKESELQTISSKGIQPTTEFVQDGFVGDVSHTNHQGSKGEGEIQIRQPELPQFRQEGYWTTEPELGRVANGIPNRMDRIKCLGNAVVPQCAEVFAKAIKMKLISPNLNNTEDKEHGE